MRMKASLQPSSSSTAVDLWVPPPPPSPSSSPVEGRGTHRSPSSHLLHVPSVSDHSPPSSSPSYLPAVDSSSSSTFSAYTGRARLGSHRVSPSSFPSSACGIIPSLSPFPENSDPSPPPPPPPSLPGEAPNLLSSYPSPSALLGCSPSSREKGVFLDVPSVDFSSQETSLPCSQGGEAKETRRLCFTSLRTFLENGDDDEGKATAGRRDEGSGACGEGVGRRKCSNGDVEERADTMSAAGGSIDDDEDVRLVKRRRKACFADEGLARPGRADGDRCVFPLQDGCRSARSGGENRGQRERREDEGDGGRGSEGREDLAQDSAVSTQREASRGYRRVLRKDETRGNPSEGISLESPLTKGASGEERDEEERRNHCSSRSADTSSSVAFSVSDGVSRSQRAHEEPVPQVYIHPTSSACLDGPTVSSDRPLFRSLHTSKLYHNSSSNPSPSECDSSSSSSRSSSFPLLSVSSSVTSSSGVRTPEEVQPCIPAAASSVGESLLPPPSSSPPPSEAQQPYRALQCGDTPGSAQSQNVVDLAACDSSSSSCVKRPRRVRATKSKRRDRRHSRQKFLSTSEDVDTPSTSAEAGGGVVGSDKKSLKGDGLSRSPSVTKNPPACVVLGCGAAMPDREVSGTSLIGLINLGGGSCFLNAVLQCLANFQPLRDFYLQWSDTLPPREVMGRQYAVYTKHIERLAPPSRRRVKKEQQEEKKAPPFSTSVSWEIATVINHMWRVPETVKFLKPDALYRACCRIMPHFDPHEMQDSDEFLRLLFDFLDAELRAAVLQMPLRDALLIHKQPTKWESDGSPPPHVPPSSPSSATSCEAPSPHLPLQSPSESSALAWTSVASGGASVAPQTGEACQARDTKKEREEGEGRRKVDGVQNGYEAPCGEARTSEKEEGVAPMKGGEDGKEGAEHGSRPASVCMQRRTSCEATGGHRLTSEGTHPIPDVLPAGRREDRPTDSLGTMASLTTAASTSNPSSISSSSSPESGDASRSAGRDYSQSLQGLEFSRNKATGHEGREVEFSSSSSSGILLLGKSSPDAVAVGPDVGVLQHAAGGSGKDESTSKRVCEKGGCGHWSSATRAIASSSPASGGGDDGLVGGVTEKKSVARVPHSVAQERKEEHLKEWRWGGGGEEEGAQQEEEGVVPPVSGATSVPPAGATRRVVAEEDRKTTKAEPQQGNEKNKPREKDEESPSGRGHGLEKEKGLCDRKGPGVQNQETPKTSQGPIEKETGDGANSSYVDSVQTLFSLVFEGGEVDEVRCGGCGRRTATIVPFKSLAIAMTREAQEQACLYASWRAKPSSFFSELVPVDLVECLDRHFADDSDSLKLSSGEGYYCCRCGKKQDAVKRCCLVKDQLPFVLCLTLKRFVRGQSTYKIWNPVRFAEVLDLSRYVMKANDEPPLRTPPRPPAVVSVEASSLRGGNSAFDTGNGTNVTRSRATSEVVLKEEDMAEMTEEERRKGDAKDGEPCVYRSISSSSSSSPSMSQVPTAASAAFASSSPSRSGCSTDRAEFASSFDRVSASSSACYQYCLVALIEHEGHAIDQGHYVCYVKHLKTGKWFKADDKVVTYVDFESQVLTAAPYMLFYERMYTPNDEVAERTGGQNRAGGTPPTKAEDSSSSLTSHPAAVNGGGAEISKDRKEEEGPSPESLRVRRNEQSEEPLGEDSRTAGEVLGGVQKKEEMAKEDTKGWWRRERATRQWDWSSWSDQVKRISSLFSPSLTPGQEKHTRHPSTSADWSSTSTRRSSPAISVKEGGGDSDATTTTSACSFSSAPMATGRHDAGTTSVGKKAGGGGRKPRKSSSSSCSSRVGVGVVSEQRQCGREESRSSDSASLGRPLSTSQGNSSHSKEEMSSSSDKVSPHASATNSERTGERSAGSCGPPSQGSSSSSSGPPFPALFPADSRTPVSGRNASVLSSSFESSSSSVASVGPVVEASASHSVLLSSELRGEEGGGGDAIRTGIDKNEQKDEVDAAFDQPRHGGGDVVGRRGQPEEAQKAAEDEEEAEEAGRLSATSSGLPRESNEAHSVVVCDDPALFFSSQSGHSAGLKSPKREILRSFPASPSFPRKKDGTLAVAVANPPTTTTTIVAVGQSPPFSPPPRAETPLLPLTEAQETDSPAISKTETSTPLCLPLPPAPPPQSTCPSKMRVPRPQSPKVTTGMHLPLPSCRTPPPRHFPLSQRTRTGSHGDVCGYREEEQEPPHHGDKEEDKKKDKRPRAVELQAVNTQPVQHSAGTGAPLPVAVEELSPYADAKAELLLRFPPPPQQRPPPLECPSPRLPLDSPGTRESVRLPQGSLLSCTPGPILHRRRSLEDLVEREALPEKGPGHENTLDWPPPPLSSVPKKNEEEVGTVSTQETPRESRDLPEKTTSGTQTPLSREEGAVGLQGEEGRGADEHEGHQQRAFTAGREGFRSASVSSKSAGLMAERHFGGERSPRHLHQSGQFLQEKETSEKEQKEDLKKTWLLQRGLGLEGRECKASLPLSREAKKGDEVALEGMKAGKHSSVVSSPSAFFHTFSSPSSPTSQAYRLMQEAERVSEYLERLEEARGEDCGVTSSYHLKTHPPYFYYYPSQHPGLFPLQEASSSLPTNRAEACSSSAAIASGHQTAVRSEGEETQREERGSAQGNSFVGDFVLRAKDVSYGLAASGVSRESLERWLNDAVLREQQRCSGSGVLSPRAGVLSERKTKEPIAKDQTLGDGDEEKMTGGGEEDVLDLTRVRRGTPTSETSESQQKKEWDEKKESSRSEQQATSAYGDPLGETEGRGAVLSKESEEKTEQTRQSIVGEGPSRRTTSVMAVEAGGREKTEKERDPASRVGQGSDGKAERKTPGGGPVAEKSGLTPEERREAKLAERRQRARILQQQRRRRRKEEAAAAAAAAAAAHASSAVSGPERPCMGKKGTSNATDSNARSRPSPPPRHHPGPGKVLSPLILYPGQQVVEPRHTVSSRHTCAPSSSMSGWIHLAACTGPPPLQSRQQCLDGSHDGCRQGERERDQTIWPQQVSALETSPYLPQGPSPSVHTHSDSSPASCSSARHLPSLPMWAQEGSRQGWCHAQGAGSDGCGAGLCSVQHGGRPPDSGGADGGRSAERSRDCPSSCLPNLPPAAHAYHSSGSCFPHTPPSSEGAASRNGGGDITAPGQARSVPCSNSTTTCELPVSFTSHSVPPDSPRTNSSKAPHFAPEFAAYHSVMNPFGKSDKGFERDMPNEAFLSRSTSPPAIPLSLAEKSPFSADYCHLSARPPELQTSSYPCHPPGPKNHPGHVSTQSHQPSWGFRSRCSLAPTADAVGVGAAAAAAACTTVSDADDRSRVLQMRSGDCGPNAAAGRIREDGVCMPQKHPSQMDGSSAAQSANVHKPTRGAFKHDQELDYRTQGVRVRVESPAASTDFSGDRTTTVVPPPEAPSRADDPAPLSRVCGNPASHHSLLICDAETGRLTETVSATYVQGVFGSGLLQPRSMPSQQEQSNRAEFTGDSSKPVVKSTPLLEESSAQVCKSFPGRASLCPRSSGARESTNLLGRPAAGSLSSACDAAGQCGNQACASFPSGYCGTPLLRNSLEGFTPNSRPACQESFCNSGATSAAACPTYSSFSPEPGYSFSNASVFGLEASLRCNPGGSSGTGGSGRHSTYSSYGEASAQTSARSDGSDTQRSGPSGQPFLRERPGECIPAQGKLPGAGVPAGTGTHTEAEGGALAGSELERSPPEEARGCPSPWCVDSMAGTSPVENGRHAGPCIPRNPPGSLQEQQTAKSAVVRTAPANTPGATRTRQAANQTGRRKKKQELPVTAPFLAGNGRVESRGQDLGPGSEAAARCGAPLGCPAPAVQSAGLPGREKTGGPSLLNAVRTEVSSTSQMGTDCGQQDTVARRHEGFHLPAHRQDTQLPGHQMGQQPAHGVLTLAHIEAQKNVASRSCSSSGDRRSGRDSSPSPLCESRAAVEFSQASRPRFSDPVPGPWSGGQQLLQHDGERPWCWVARDSPQDHSCTQQTRIQSGFSIPERAPEVHPEWHTYGGSGGIGSSRHASLTMPEVCSNPSRDYE